MSADEDTELRDLLIQTLEKNGSLGKIKAELRASVFLALDSQENFENCSLVNPTLQKFFNEKDSVLSLELVLQFLQSLDLDYTASVFQPETNNKVAEKINDVSLCERLKIQESSSNVPILTKLIRQSTEMPSYNTKASTPSNNQLLKAKQFFQSKDRNSSGFVTCSDVVDIFAVLCPIFPVFLIERFVNEELSKSSNPVTWNDFVCLYEKLFVACQNVVTDQSDLPDSSFPTQMAQFHQNIDSLPESLDCPPQSVSQMPANSDHFDNVLNKPASKSFSSSKSHKEEDEMKSDATKQSNDYEDDFTADSQSIPEDIPTVSGLSSSSNNSLTELTEDRTLSLQLDVDYMEEASSV